MSRKGGFAKGLRPAAIGHHRYLGGVCLYTSRFRTSLAWACMKALRGGTCSPISMVKTSSALTASSISTCSIVLVLGSMVVSHSCSGLISPSPLYRCTSTFLFPFVPLYVDLLVLQLRQQSLFLFFGIHPVLLFSCLYAVERRLGNVQVTLLNEIHHIAEEEGEQQGTDMSAVDVSISHDNDAMVAQFQEVYLFPDPRTQGGNKSTYLFMSQHPVGRGLLYIQYLALKRQDRLEIAVPSLLS